jgi:hypothetical protein
MAEYSDNNGISIQRVLIDGEWRKGEGFKALPKEWRRRRSCLHGTLHWGEWIDIDGTIEFILSDEDTQRYFTDRWDRHKILDKDYLKYKGYGGSGTGIGEIAEQIKMGTAKIHHNKLV